MGKLIRRCGAFMMMLLLMSGILPMTANAETTQDTEEKNALYVQVPEDWENPCVWAWDSDGNNAFAAWPGEEMEADTENAGWYYVWLPDWANHVIVNANEGSVQTDEQILNTNTAWITVKAADAVEISYEKQTTGEAPAYVEKFVVHAKVDETWVFFVKYFSLKRASEFPVFVKGFSLLSAGHSYASLRMRACSIR